MDLERITYEIIGAAFTIHKALGPGLLESAYRNCMAYELKRRKLDVECEKTLPLVYAGVRTAKGYRLDLFVEKQVIVEVKAAKQIYPIDETQLNTYLNLANCKIGLLLNFNVRWMKEGVRRIINPSYIETSES